VHDENQDPPKRTEVDMHHIPHDPQMPSRHDRRKVKEESCSVLILIKASSTMGPHCVMSILYTSILDGADDSGL
jgi:hypothetical protein